MKHSLSQLVEFFKKHKLGRLSLALGFVGLIVGGALFVQSSRRPQPIALSEVAAAIAAGQVVKVEDTQDGAVVTLHYKDGSRETSRRDQASSFLEQMERLGVSTTQMSNLHYEIVEKSSLTGEKAVNTVISISMLGLMAYALTRVTGGGLVALRKKYTEGVVPDIRFQDIAGVDECRDELVDIVTFLKDNSRYQSMGARMPRGVLLVGDPGTGKTLLAKAIAGEAGVPFFSTSGSEFVELFVGLGASRVRGLVQEGPCQGALYRFH